MKIHRADCGARTKKAGSQSDRQEDVIRVMQNRRLMPVTGAWISTHVHRWGSLPESDTGFTGSSCRLKKKSGGSSRGGLDRTGAEKPASNIRLDRHHLSIGTLLQRSISEVKKNKQTKSQCAVHQRAACSIYLL